MPRGRFQRDSLLGEKKCDETETFCQRHTEDGLNEDLAGSGGITADSFGGFGANETDSESSGEYTSGTGDVTGNSGLSDLSEYVHDFILFVLSVVHVIGYMLPTVKGFNGRFLWRERHDRGRGHDLLRDARRRDYRSVRCKRT